MNLICRIPDKPLLVWPTGWKLQLYLLSHLSGPSLQLKNKIKEVLLSLSPSSATSTFLDWLTFAIEVCAEWSLPSFFFFFFFFFFNFVFCLSRVVPNVAFLSSHLKDICPEKKPSTSLGLCFWIDLFIHWVLNTWCPPEHLCLYLANEGWAVGQSLQRPGGHSVYHCQRSAFGSVSMGNPDLFTLAFI